MDISPDNMAAHGGFLPLTLISISRNHPCELLKEQKETFSASYIFLSAYRLLKFSGGELVECLIVIV